MKLDDLAARLKARSQPAKAPPNGAKTATPKPSDLFVPPRVNAVKGSMRETFSFLKIARYVHDRNRSDSFTTDEVKHELDLSRRIREHFETRGMTDIDPRAILIPTSWKFFPTTRDGESQKLVEEIREKLALRVDPDELQHEAKLAGGTTAKALGTLLETAGGTLRPFPEFGDLIDLQRNYEGFSRAGASEVGFGPTGQTVHAKLTGGATGYWVGEGSAITESQETTGSLLLSAKYLGVLVKINNQLLQFGTPGSEALIRNDMARAAGLKADSAMFDGVGGTQIKGLLNYATQASWMQGTDAVIAYTASTTGTNGNTFEAQDIALMLAELPDEVEPTAWLMRRKMFSVLQTRRAAAVASGDNEGPFISPITYDPRDPNRYLLGGAPVTYSSNVPKNRVKGSGTTLTCVIAGDFKDWVIARSPVIQIVPNGLGDTPFVNNQTWLRAIQYIDAGPRHLASFVVCDDLLES